MAGPFYSPQETAPDGSEPEMTIVIRIHSIPAEAEDEGVLELIAALLDDNHVDYEWSEEVKQRATEEGEVGYDDEPF